MKSYQNDLSTDQCLRVVDELAKVKVFFLAFAGVEPLLRKDFFKIARYAKSKQTSLELCTNGTIVTEGNIEEIKEIGFNGVQVSLDGSTAAIHESVRGKGTFERTLRGIRLLARAGVPVIISTVIMQSNKNDIVNIIKEAANLGCGTWRMEVLLAVGRGGVHEGELKVGRHELAVVFRQIAEFENGKEGQGIRVEYPCYIGFAKARSQPDQADSFSEMYSCGAGVQRATILPDGSMVACDFLQDDVLGNIVAEGIEKVWMGNPKLEKWRVVKPLKGKCGGCALGEQCGGGCRAGALLTSGDFWGEDPLCWLDERKVDRSSNPPRDLLALPLYPGKPEIIST